MTGGDAGLEMIFGELIAGGGLREVKHAARDQRLVPFGAVLFLEAKQVAFVIHARGNARGVQEHQGEQRVRLGLVAGGIFHEQTHAGEWLPGRFLRARVFRRSRLCSLR